MNSSERQRFNKLYQRHLQALRLQGMADSTRDVYARAVRRLRDFHGVCPDQLSVEQIQDYFAVLVETHSWSTVKVDRNGIQFFWRHVLKRDWDWVSIVRPPKVTTLPDILSQSEIQQLITTARVLRYQVFILTTYSLGLRLSETLHLQVGDIDADRLTVHVRRGKGHKDRFLPLPHVTLQALRHLWTTHRNPVWLFPSQVGSPERIQQATGPMDRGGTQHAVKAIIESCGIKKKSRSTLCATASPHTY